MDPEPGSRQRLTSGQGTWSARCGESRTPGAGGGHGKRIGGNADAAPVAYLTTTQSTVTWVLTAYLLSASIMTPILGRIGDMIGKERVFVATLGRRSPVTRSGSR